MAELKSSLTQREYASWQRYWIEEPWGPFRDNLHAAIVAREVRRPQLRKGAKSELDEFMVINPQTRRAEATANMLNYLKLIAKPVKRNG